MSIIETEMEVLKSSFAYSFLCLEKTRPNITFSRLSGGISNINYLIDFPGGNRSPVIMTVYPERSKWIKLEKEYYVRGLIQGVSNVPIQRILSSGVAETENGECFAYLIKEYLKGNTLNNVLATGEMIGLQEQDWQDIASDLGAKLAILHSQPLPVFGRVIGNEIVGPDGAVSNPYVSWKKSYASALQKRFQAVDEVSPNKQVGNCQAGDIQALLPSLYELAFQNIKGLDDVVVPYFVHNDVNFLNVLAYFEDGFWRISGILDLEAVMAGDPDIDLVAIESQLHLSQYRDQFMKNVECFRRSYRSRKAVSQSYQQKRIPYHISRSLSYFEAVFQMDFKLIPISNVNQFFMQRHYEILQSLANGAQLEDMGIFSLF